MNAVELHTPDGQPCGVFLCGRCRRVHDWGGQPARLPDPSMPWKDKPDVLAEHADHCRQSAEECCSAKCGVCGELVPYRGYRYCPAHRDEGWRRDEAGREKEAFSAAKERTDYAGPFLVTDAGESKLLDSLTAVVEHYEAADEPVPEYVWVPRLATLSLDANNIIENAIENDHDSEQEDEIGTSDRKELQALLDGWCAKQTVGTWHEERTEYVRVPRPTTEG